MRSTGEILGSLIARAPDIAPGVAYRCQQCKDRGYYGDPARRCPCYLERPIRERLAEAGVGLDLIHSSWENYDGTSPDFSTFPAPDHCIVMRGPVGTGKSHASVAVLREWLESGGSGIFREADAFVTECRSAFDRGLQPADVIARYLQRGLIVLDECWSSKKTDFADEVVSMLIRRCMRDLHPLVLNTNLEWQQIREIEPRVASRVLGNGSIPYDFDGLPDRRQAAGGTE